MTETAANAQKTVKDGLLRLSVGDGAIAILVRSTHMVEQARQAHGLSPLATVALGRLLSGAVMMAARTKEETGSTTVTVRGGGPLGALVAVARPNGTVKGYVDEPGLFLPPSAGGSLDVAAAVGTEGTLTVIRDFGLGDAPYVGQVEMQTGQIGDDLAWYYTKSEQQDAIIAVGVRLKEGKVVSAGGALVTPLPGADEQLIKELANCAPLLTDISGMVMGDDPLSEIAKIAFFGLETKPLTEKESPVTLRCDCSRTRIERALISMGKKELAELIEDQGEAEVSCHFCHKEYQFDREQLIRLLADAQTGSAGLPM